MVLLGTRHAFVVHGDSGDGSGMDEISIGGSTSIAEVRNGKVILSTFTPEDAGLEARITPANSRVETPPTNAQILRNLYRPESPAPAATSSSSTPPPSSSRLGLAHDLTSGVHLARQAIDEGSVTRLITELTVVRPM